jgi:hypothetical protein
MDIKSLKEALPYLFKAEAATCIVGHHGVGKSQAIAQYAKENGFEMIDLRLGTQDVGDLLGLADFERDKDGNLVATKFMRPDWFPTDPKSKGIIFMDEMNRATRPVLQAVFQLVLDKKLHRYSLPEVVYDKNGVMVAGWHIVTAMNPSTEDYIVTDISDKAFLDRFCHIKLTPTRSEFIDHARNTDVSASVISFLENQPELIQTDLEDFDLDVKPSRRSWFALDRIYKQKPPQHILMALAKGLVGSQASMAFIKSLSTTDKPIVAEDILKSFPKLKKRIVDYSNPKNSRIDMLKFTSYSLLQYCKKREEQLNKDESKNLADFLKLIPTDLSYALARELYMECDCARHVIDEHIELLTEMANKRDMKIKGLNK